MKDSTKILILPSFYPMKFSYSGSFFEEQARLIRKNDVEVVVVYNENRTISSFSIKKFIQVHFQTQYKIEENVPVFRRMNWNIIPVKKFTLGRKIWIRDSIKLVEKYIQKYGRPTLIHVHCALNAGSVAKYIKEKWGIPYIITEHNSDYGYFEISPLKLKETLDIYQNAEKVIAVSSYLKNLISEKIGFNKEKIDVIPNFIDTEYFDPHINSSLAEPRKGKVIFTVCYFFYRKRVDRLIDAFKIISEHHPEWRLVIGGNGEEEENLKSKVRKLGLEDKVIFLGFLTKEQVRDNMKNADIFVLSSDVETFGVVLIEAMSMGLPVVATASGGSEDIVTPQTGVLAKRSTEDIAKGILYIISNYDKYNREQIRAYAIGNFSGKAVTGKYIDLYDKIVFK